MRRRGREVSLRVDGKEFPWRIASDGLDLCVIDDAMPAVRLTLLAERVEVVDELLQATTSEPTSPTSSDQDNQ